MSRRGGWITTYSGLKMYPLDPRPEEICIEDIAHALSNICRFTGHCREFYSVGNHSFSVSMKVSIKNALWGLLHDASEAYLYDISRPVKASAAFAGYRKIESRLQSVIVKKYGLSVVMPEEVKKMDDILLVTEARDLGLLTPEWNMSKIKPLRNKIIPMYPKEAERAFLERFYYLEQNFI
jgi:uncharacterized protein